MMGSSTDPWGSFGRTLGINWTRCPFFRHYGQGVLVNSLSVWTPSRGYAILAPQFKVTNSPLTTYTNSWNAQFSKHPARQSKSWTRLLLLLISMLWTRTLRRYTPSFGSRKRG